MPNTIQITINTGHSAVAEELIAHLSFMDFDGFEERDSKLISYIKEENLDVDLLNLLISRYKLKYEKSVIEDQNWNALWESNFEPVEVDDFCGIRAEFHPSFTDKEYEIIITPKMSFGTGHHATTYMMISEMRKINFINRTVADFGIGTGVLAILAEKLGSRGVWATDNDDWSIENAAENIEKNGCKNVKIEKAEGFRGNQQFDIILANINKSVITANADDLLLRLKNQGVLLLSGLLQNDEKDIIDIFTLRNLQHISTLIKNQWICLLFRS